MPTTVASLEQRRLTQIGVVLWALGCLVGFVLLVWMFVLLPLLTEPDPLRLYLAELVALGFALPACFVYIWVPVLIDRFDPEPWWALLMTFLWGALAAAGLAGFINSVLGIAGGVVAGELGAAFMGGVVSAPLTEEALKGAAVLGMLWFVRREFDGIVDGVIYATFSALGFAMTENVLYYSRGLVAPEAGAFVGVVVLRGVLEPWAHPLFSSLFGIGIGIARETHRTWLRWVAPLLGYLAAVVLHAMWNGVAVFSGLVGIPFHLLLVIAYFFVMLLFLALMVGLVAREGYQLRRHLRDEVPLGYLTPEQLDLICSPLGRLQAHVRHGSKGRLLVKAGVRLGMAKWHASRALQGEMHTISSDAVGPLRGEVIRLSRELRPHDPSGATQSSG